MGGLGPPLQRESGLVPLKAGMPLSCHTTAAHHHVVLLPHDECSALLTGTTSNHGILTPLLITGRICNHECDGAHGTELRRGYFSILIVAYPSSSPIWRASIRHFAGWSLT